MHAAIISLRAHFVYVLSISVQYVGCNLAVNIYVVFSGPISVISLGTPDTKRLRVESYASSHKLTSWKLHLLRTMACQVRLSPIPYMSEGSLRSYARLKKQDYQSVLTNMN